MFSASKTGGTDHHGVGFCHNRRTEKYRNHYLQHSSHLAEMEINMHGEPLVILSAYMPHDASNEIKRLAAWEEMFNIIKDISHNKNVVVLVLGVFNAALHARKTGEEECLGPHIWGKGTVFLREKEGLLPENMNRGILIDLLKAHDMRCMNTCFQKPTVGFHTFSLRNFVLRVSSPKEMFLIFLLTRCRISRGWGSRRRIL